MPNWAENPLACADEVILRQGPQKLSETFAALLETSAVLPPSIAHMRGVVQDVNKNGHFAMGRTRVNGVATLLQDFTQHSPVECASPVSSETPFEICFLHVVPIPGQQWCKNESQIPYQPTVSKNKRSFDADEPKPESAQQPVVWGDVDAARNYPKEHPSENSDSYVLRVVLPSSTPDADIDTNDYTPRLNSIIEFYGVVTEPRGVMQAPDSFLMELPFAQYSVYSQKAREIATIFWRNTSLIPSPRTNTFSGQDMKGLRETLSRYLTSIFSGDRVVAEAVLLHLVSNVFDVHPVPIGSVPLNITNVSKEDALVVIDKLKGLLGQVIAYGVTVPLLNQNNWVPHMNYEKEALQSGKLQLPDATHLFLDETHLAEGKLTALGMDNLKALKQVGLTGQIAYPFTGYALEMEIKTPLLIVSQNVSLLKPAHVVKWVKSDPVEFTPSEEVLTQLRIYIERMRVFLTELVFLKPLPRACQYRPPSGTP